MTEKTSRKGLYIAVAVIAVVIVAAVLVVEFTQRGGFRGVINPPNVKIVSRDLDTTLEGLDYVAYVYVTVKNEGGAGSATVYVKVMQGGDSWTKSRSVYLDSGESSDLTFKFSEIEFWTTYGVTYTVWIG